MLSKGQEFEAVGSNQGDAEAGQGAPRRRLERVLEYLKRRLPSQHCVS